MVDVIIPVYKPTEYLLSLFVKLSKQTVLPNKVIVINTGREYWDKFFGSFDILKKYPFIELHHIEPKDFDHGNTRNMGVKLSNAEHFLMMTDDSVPEDEYLIERMLTAFDDKNVAMCYARQLPHKGCRAIEKYTRQFNYPPVSMTKKKADIESMGIKAFFASNVCCMYSREIFDKLLGFTKKTIFNEDMIFARRAIDEGYYIRYEAGAKVRHSHNYSGKEYFKRNFDLGVSHADHPEIFGDVKSEGEGIKLVKSTASFLCKKLMPWMVFVLVYHSACKYLGYKKGLNYKKLPMEKVMEYTMNPRYFA